MSYRDKGPYGGWEDQNKLNESSTVSVEGQPHAFLGL